MPDALDLAPADQARIITQQLETFRFQRQLELVKLAVLDGMPEALRSASWQEERGAVEMTVARQENAIETLRGLLTKLPPPGPPLPP